MTATLANGALRKGAARILWGVVAFGLLLRTVEYLECRSLWLDESFLSLNVLQKPFSELHKPLDYNQGAPYGFLIAQKLCVTAFGSSEYALRLFPFLCGVVALVVFARLVWTELPPATALIAVVLFAVTDPLIHYACEAKQYGSDAAINVLLVATAFRSLRRDFDLRSSALLGAAGAIAVFMSHPSVFVLAGLGLTLGIDCLIGRRWSRIRRLALVFTCWALGFALCYAINLRLLSKDPFFEEFWRQDFLPSFFDLRWIQRFLVSRYFDFLALTPRNLPLYLLVVLGLARLIRANPIFLSFLVMPLGFAMAASVLHKYPLFERFLVFSIPSTLIILAAGIGMTAEAANRLGPWGAKAITAVLLAYPVAHGAATLWTHRTIQDLKPVLSYVREHRQPDDLVFVSQLAAYPFKYYASRYGFNSEFDLPETYVDPSLGEKYANTLQRRYDRAGFNPIILGYCSYFTTTGDTDLAAEIKPVLGAPRVWVICSHGDGAGLANVQLRTTQLLDTLGKRLDTFERPGLWGGSAAYLYDLRPKGGDAAPR